MTDDPYAVTVHDETMAPRFEPGNVLLIAPGYPVEDGSNVVIELTDGSMRVLVFKHRDWKLVVCEQLNPRMPVTIPRKRIRAMHAVASIDYLAKAT